MQGRSDTHGFTLIEISIVLVIIGLIVGGILVGQDLIRAAAGRAQISQIEKYNTAVNTFVTKYGYLPGDIPDPYASNFGFIARGQFAGEGDGNGLIESNFQNLAGMNGHQTANNGEAIVFWRDLNAAALVPGNFTFATNSVASGPNIYSYTTPPISSYVPEAKIGNGNSVYVFSSSANKNYFGISNISIIGWGMASSPSISVAQAFAIDKKIDDGLPQSGTVQALYYSNSGADGFLWAGGYDADGGSYNGIPVPFTTATSGSATSCFDNSYAGGAAATQQYSMEISNGGNPNCALSFKMQGAAR